MAMINPRDYLPFKRKDKIHSRTRYLDPSLKFLEWVESLGAEKSFLGRIIYFFNTQNQVRLTFLLFLVFLVVGYILFIDIEFPYNIRVGEVARTDVRSPITLQIMNEPSTEGRRLEAERAIPPVYDFDTKAFSAPTDRVYLAFREMRSLIRQSTWPATPSGQEEAVKDFFQYKERFENMLQIQVQNVIFQWLVEKKFSARIENIVIDSLQRWSHWKIVDGNGNNFNYETGNIVAREVGSVGAENEFVIRGGELKDLRRHALFPLAPLALGVNLDKKEVEFAAEFARSLVVPNLTLNNQETFARRKKARDSVLPDQISIKKNQIIVNAGTVIQPSHAMILQEISEIQKQRRSIFVVFISAFMFTAVTVIFFSFIRLRTSRKILVEGKDILVMGIMMISMVLLTKVFLYFFDENFIAKAGTHLPTSVMLYLTPVAAGSMLIGLLISRLEIVLMYTVIQSIVLGIMVDFNMMFMIVSLVAGLSTAKWVQKCTKRNDIYWAGIKAGAVTALVTFCLVVVDQSGDAELWSSIVWDVPAAFLGTVLSSMLAMTLVPLLESFFNYTTDVKLLELANLNHTLMQEMVVRAPGTYHHSLAVGNMVEAASTAIGANALLAKVMAYYHDIGKMEHAQYFVENQRPGYNPHDHVSPYMSKTILIAHVKDGAELGMQYKLGQPIIDGILQHHGTTLISYFFNKALEEHEEGMPPIDESEFRYPGPKPQFREAGLVMLADSIEAAARSIEEPTTARLQNLVKNIIQSKFIDGQLDECNLTMKELAVIEESFKRVLIGIYHHRIDYPHMRDGLLVQTVKPKKISVNKKDTHTA